MIKKSNIDIPCYMPFIVSFGDRAKSVIAVPREGCSEECVMKHLYLCGDMCCTADERRDHQGVQFVVLDDPYSEIVFRTTERKDVKNTKNN